MVRTFQAITDGFQGPFFNCQIPLVLCEYRPLLLDFFRVVSYGTRGLVFRFDVLKPCE